MDDWNGWQPGSPLLDGKVALVAGGGRGIGFATTRILASAGATVAVLDVDEQRAVESCEQVAALGAKALPVIADLRDEASCDAAVSYVISELGGIDVLANTAGGMSRHAP